MLDVFTRSCVCQFRPPQHHYQPEISKLFERFSTQLAAVLGFSLHEANSLSLSKILVKSRDVLFIRFQDHHESVAGTASKFPDSGKSPVADLSLVSQHSGRLHRSKSQYQLIKEHLPPNTNLNA